MKRTKHLLLLVLLLTVVTGGVYATWTYATKPAVDQNVTDNTIDIEAADVVERGTISTSASNFSIKFDDVDFDHVVSKNASELVFSGSDLTVTFTPAKGTNIDLGCDNYHLNYVLSSELTNIAGDKVLTGDVKDLTLTWTGSAYEGVINTEMLLESINKVDLSLATKDEYDTFQKKLASASFVITLSDDADVAQIK